MGGSLSELQAFGRTQLSRHLGFIERACRDFDSGHQEAALQIALSCRTLFHNTKKQTGLISQVGWNDLSLLSTAVDLAHNLGGALSALSVSSDPNTPPAQRPFLGDIQSEHHVLPWTKWWEERVYPDYLGALTRRDLVTIAADKEIAHPDRKLPPLYAQLKAGVWQFTSKRMGTRRVAEMQLADLRQMGFELLHSPALMGLIGRPPLVDLTAVAAKPVNVVEGQLVRNFPTST